MGTIYNSKICRRAFLKCCLAGGTAFIAGCASNTSPAKDTGINPKPTKNRYVCPDTWETDNIIPLPKGKILFGENAQVTHPHFQYPGIIEQSQVQLTVDFKTNYGVRSAFSLYGHGLHGFVNDEFPSAMHDSLNKAGVIPVARYTTWPFHGFKEVNDGKFDDVFKSLADKVAENGVPMVIIPYQSVNEPHANYYPHGSGTPSRFKDIFVRMHDFFEAAGANENTIWSTKFRLGQQRRWGFLDPFSYMPPEEYVDWVGWATNNNCWGHIGLGYLPFDRMMGNKHDKAAELYPDKPQFLWEISSMTGRSQYKWLKQAFDALPTEYPMIRGVTLDVMRVGNPGEKLYFDPRLTKKSKKIMRDKASNHKPWEGPFLCDSQNVLSGYQYFIHPLISS